MKTGLIVDIVLLVILALCVWNGYKNGFIRGIFGLLAVVIALYGASLAAKMYSNEFTSMFKPFVGGLLDRSINRAVGEDTGDEEGVTRRFTTSFLAEDTTDVYEVSYAALRNIGLSDNAAEKMAREVSDGVSKVGRDMSQYLTRVVCGRVAYVCVFLLAFILIAVALAIVGNALDIVFAFPGLGIIDSILGAIFGVAKGLMIILAICMFLRYTGLLINDHIVEESYIMSRVLNSNPLANLIGL